MKIVYLNRIAKASLLVLVFLFGSVGSLLAQCPAAPPCTQTVTGNTPINLSAGQRVCISGTYTGSVSNFPATSEIYVPAGATFSPSGMGSVSGKITNCGTATLPGFSFSGTDTVKIFNYNQITFSGGINFNTPSSFFNGLDAVMHFTMSNLTMDKTRFYNNGNVIVDYSFTMNNAGTSFINRDTLIANGNIILGGTIQNEGYLFAKGNNIIINSGGNITNGCYFIADAGFTKNAGDTLKITGYIWVTGKNGSDFNVQGPIWASDSGFLEGVNFLNNASVTGKGRYRFTGSTTSQGTVGSGSNFYDVSLTGPPNRIFDSQNQFSYPGVTKNIVAPRQGNYVPNTCSEIIKNNFCDLNTGPDLIVCGNTTTANLPPAKTGQVWAFLSSPTGVTPTITSPGGAVSGMTAYGDYYFLLTKPALATCRDTVKVTRKQLPSASLTVNGSTVCATSPNATVTIIGVRSGESYQAYEGGVAKGNPVTSNTNGNVILTIPLGQSATQLDTTVRYHTIQVKGSVVGCADVTLSDTGTVVINRTPSAALTVTGSTVCASSPNANVTIAGTTSGQVYQAYEGNTAIGAPVTSNGGNVTLILPLGQVTGRLDSTVRVHTIRVTASIAGCSKVVSLTDTGTVFINRTPNAGLTVNGSTVCASSPNATVTIIGTTSGQVYQAYEGNAAIGAAVSSNGGNVVLTLPLGQTAGRLDSTVRIHTIRVTASISGCSKVVALTDTGTVFINRTPNAGLTVSGSTVCANATNATVTVSGTTSGQVYQAYEGNTAIGAPVISSGGLVTLQLPLGQTTGKLDSTIRLHTIRLTASISGCSKTVSLTDTGTVIINRTPNPNAVLSATSPICLGNTSSISISPIDANVVYRILDNGTQIGTMGPNQASKLFSFSTVGTHIISATASISQCAIVTLKDTATVVVNKLPSATVTVNATTPVCVGGNSTVTIRSSENGVIYSVAIGTNPPIGTITGNGGDVSKAFAMPSIAGTYNIKVTATIGGCSTVTVTSSPSVLVNPVPNKTLDVTASGPICQGGKSTIGIVKSENGIKYRIYDGTTLLDSIIGTGSATVPASKAVTLPFAGLRTIRVTAEVGGCAVVDLDDKPTVQVNTGSDVTLAVSATSPICQGDTSFVKITKAQNGVGYQVLEGSTILSPIVNGTGGDLTFSIINLSAGTHTLTINANTPGCGAVALSTHPVVVVNPIPNDVNLQLTGDIVCSNGDTATVTVRNTQAGVSYQAKTTTGPIGRAVVSPSNNATIVLRLPVSGLAIGINTISLSGTIGGCGTINFTKTTTVVKNQLPDPAKWTLVGDTICANSDSAYIEVRNAELGVRYQSMLNGVYVGSAKTRTSSTNSTVILGIQRGALQIGTNTLRMSAKIDSCAEVISINTVSVLVRDIPNIAMEMVDTTVCSNTGFANVVIKNTKKDQVFQGYWKKSPIGLPVTSTADGSNVVLQIPIATIGVGTHFISAKVSISGCATLTLKDSAKVIVNQFPSTAPTVTGDTICSDSVQARLFLRNTQVGVTYSAYKGTVLVGSAKAVGTSVTIPINANGFAIGSNILTLKAVIPGCDTVTYTPTGNVYVNPRPNYALTFSASGPVCIGGFSTIKIVNAEKNVIYTILEEGVAVDTIFGKGVTASKQISMQHLGDRIITIKATINGCSDGLLNGKDTVRVNTGSDTKLNVTATSPVCVGSPISVKIQNSDPDAVYKVVVNNVVVSDSLQGTGKEIALTIDSLPAGIHELQIRATTAGCGVFQLEKKPKVTVDDKLKAGLKVIGDTVCNTSDTATVTIVGVKKRQIYSAYLGTTKLAQDSVTADGNITLYLLVKNLNEGLNKINVKAAVGGCGEINLRDSASVLVNPKPDVNLAMTDDTVCRNSLFASVSVMGTRIGETYYAFLNDTTSLDTVLSAGGTIVLSLPVDSLATGLNKVSVQVFIPGCGFQTLNGNSFITVNPLPADTFAVFGDTVCSGADFARVTIKSTLANQVFQAYESGRVIGLPKKSTGGDLVLDIPVLGTLPKGSYEISIKATIRGCDSVLLKNTAKLLINDAPQPTLTVIGDTVCTNSDTATVQILGTKVSESYVARINGVTISDSVISIGGTVTLKIPTKILPKDTNEVTVYTNVIGCGEAPLSNKAWIIINQLPTDTLKVQGDTVCENSTEAIVKINNATKDVEYSAWLNGILVSDRVTSTGGDVFLKLPIFGLSLDTNKIAIRASINGCANVTLRDSALVIVNKKPTLTIEVLGSVVCSTADTATVTIEGTDKGAVYQAMLNGSILGQPVVGTGANVILKLPISGLAFDTNLVSISVTVRGCGGSMLDKLAKVVVNKLPSDSLLTDGSTACKGSLSASVTVYNSQKNVGYQVFLENDTVGTVVLGTGGTIQLPVFVNKLKIGINKVTVKTSLEKCNVITLKDTALVVVNDNGGADSAVVKGSSVCFGQDAFVTLSKSQVGITYNLYIKNQPTNLKLIGTGKTDTLWIPNSLNLLDNGGNKVSFTADIPSCNTVNLTSTSTVYILRDPNATLKGDDLLCYGGIGRYDISVIPGAKYYWVVGDSAKIIKGQGSQVINVQFDSLNSYVAVMPVGDLGICHQDSIGKFVTIKAPIHGDAKVTGRDTVCTGEIDTIQVIGQKGVLRYRFELPNGVELVKRIDTDSASDSLVVRYTKAGWVTWSFLPYSECAQKYDSSSLVVWKVRVIGTPIAEANEYDNVEEQMFVGTANVPLNGNGSSVGDSISYKWYTEKGVIAQIENSASQNGAVLNTAVKQIKVYLTVTNIQGLCPVVDSAIIKLNFDLDIPNVFSPNNDGTHDIWEIKNITTFYPNVVVEVFNKWGSLVWKSDVGYHEPWDGKRNGEDMPVATYYYVLDRKNGSKPNVGSVTIIR